MTHFLSQEELVHKSFRTAFPSFGISKLEGTLESLDLEGKQLGEGMCFGPGTTMGIRGLGAPTLLSQELMYLLGDFEPQTERERKWGKIQN